ncbi:MAG: hypothetical protein WEA99_00105 [Brumimicrobium sp.]
MKLNLYFKLFFISTIFFLISLASFSQDTSTSEQRAKHLSALHKNLFSLEDNSDDVINEILPLIEDSRTELAPNYPKRPIQEHSTFNELIINWIENYPEEANNYIEYLENYLRNY